MVAALEQCFIFVGHDLWMNYENEWPQNFGDL